jgi:hypothetical protein
MRSHRHILPALAAAVLTLVSLAGDGIRKPLLAEEAEACILGGSGVLCYTKQIQRCTNYGLAGWTLGTSFSMSTTCIEWTTIMEYYYRDGSGTVKPALK